MNSFNSHEFLYLRLLKRFFTFVTFGIETKKIIVICDKNFPTNTDVIC